MKNLSKFKNLQNKMEVFNDYNELLKYVETQQDFAIVFNMLTDQEKFEVVQKNYFFGQDEDLRRETLSNIKDDSIKEQIFNNENLRNKIINDSIFIDMVAKMSDVGKIKILCNKTLLKEYNISLIVIERWIKTLSQENIKEILNSSELLEQLHIDNNSKASLLTKIQDDEYKSNYLNKYQFNTEEKKTIIGSYSDKNKINSILNSTEGMYSFQISELLSTLNAEVLIQFFNENKEFIGSKRNYNKYNN